MGLAAVSLKSIFHITVWNKALCSAPVCSQNQNDALNIQIFQKANLCVWMCVCLPQSRYKKICTQASVSLSPQHHLILKHRAHRLGVGGSARPVSSRLSACLLISWSPGHLPARPLSDTAVTTHALPIADVEKKSAAAGLHT